MADLLRASAVSHDRLAQVLVDSARCAVEAVIADHKPAGPGMLARATIPALFAALAVDVRECICHRWLPSLQPGLPLPAVVAWTLRPQLEWVIHGRPITLQLTADVRLFQGSLRLEQDEHGIRLGVDDRAWRAELQLAATDPGGAAETACFHSCVAEVYLPKGPWKL